VPPITTDRDTAAPDVTEREIERGRDLLTGAVADAA